MKKLLFSLLAVIAMSMLFSACSNEDTNGLDITTANSENSTGIATVNLNIASGIDVKEDSLKSATLKRD
jgi:hypothetical protein